MNDYWAGVDLLPHRMAFHEARPTWETERLASMRERVRPGWTIYDCGAEEGDFTALYRHMVGPEGAVVAVEPEPRYWPAIRRTWELNGFGDAPLCIPAFVGDTSHWPELGDKFKQEHEEAIRLLPDGWPACAYAAVIPDAGFRMLCERQEDTPVWRLDDLARLVQPDAIVLDVEGAEWHAMAGLQGVIDAGGTPLVWVSVHEENMLRAYGHSLGDLIRLAISWGYGYEYLGTHGGEDFWLFAPAGKAAGR